jgi:hypothetical protein
VNLVVGARLLVLVVFVAGMPCLAIPAVLERLERHYGTAAAPEPAESGTAAPAPAAAPAMATATPATMDAELHASRPAAAGPPAASLGASPADDRPQRDRAAQPADSSAPLEMIQNRLQLLGATYFRVEQRGGVLPFQALCDVELPGAASFRKRFVAAGADPVAAMRAVLSDVERWRASIGRRRQD